MPLPTRSVSLPVSERPVSAWSSAHLLANLIRSNERNFGRLSGMGKPVFFETPSPTNFGRKKCELKPGDKKQRKVTTNLSLVVASAPEISSHLAAFCHWYSSPFVAKHGTVSSHFNFQLLPSMIFHRCVILAGDDRIGTTKRWRKTVPQHPGTAL